ncbi:MAG: hypothetical protein LBL83_00980 [Clostridiales bacterium]|jgi:hypothetical protein|nr:hypothetical protein [Clostridiales bacterium]
MKGMKGKRKFFSIVLSLAMCVGMAAPGLAAAPPEPGEPGAGDAMAAGVHARSLNETVYYESVSEGGVAEAVFAIRGEGLHDVGTAYMQLSARAGDVDPGAPAGEAPVSFAVPDSFAGRVYVDVNLAGAVPEIMPGYLTYSVLLRAASGTTFSAEDGEDILEVRVKSGGAAGPAKKDVELLLDFLEISYWDDGKPRLADAAISPSSALASVSLFSRFDIDMNGAVELPDVDYVRYYLGSEVSDGDREAMAVVARCDLDPDGIIGIADLTLVLAKYLARGEPGGPVDPDPDPEPDPDGAFIRLVPAMIYDPQNNGVAQQSRLFDEYDAVAANPPHSASAYMPPVDSGAASNANVWRTPGSAWTEANTQFTVNFGADVRMLDIWVYDGPSYAPATLIHPDTVDKPYEVIGGAIEIYSGDVKIGAVAIENAGAWKRLNLSEAFGDGGFTAGALTFKKAQDTAANRYAWGEEGGWQSDPGQYVCDVCVPEIAVYGVALGELTSGDGEDEWVLTPYPADPVYYDYTFGEFFGTNAHFTEPAGNLDVVGLVREYHNWSWTEWSANDHADGNGQKNDSAMSLNPTVAFMNTWGAFDAYYEALANAGIEAAICIQGGVIGAPQSRPNFQGDLDSLNPASYRAHAESMFQHAARYGGTAVDEALLKVAAGTEKRTGLGLVRYFENWNEPNLGPWNGGQFAAMTSADYDGHMGTMGPGVGVKQADPGASLVLGGLAGIIYDEGAGYDPAGKGFTARQFVYDFMKWCDANRTEEQWKAAHGGSLEGYVRYPFDVFNGHYYSPDGYAQSGLSPEADRVFERMGDFVGFRDAYFPDKEIWLTEYGYDSEQGSSQSATANDTTNAGLTGQEAQGRWLVREALILAAAGLDRVTQFEMDDFGNGGMDHSPMDRFESCGMINTTGDGSPKPSWYYMGTANFLLGTAKLDRETRGIVEKGGEDGLTGPWVLDFEETQDNGTTDIFALWLPTSLGDQGGANAVSYELALPEGTERAYLVEMRDKVKWGAVSELGIIGGKVSVDVTEKPVFVLANTDEYYKPTVAAIDSRGFAVNKLTASNGDPAKLFDERAASASARPAISGSATPGAWDPGALNRYAIIDLGAKYALKDVMVYDQNGSLKAGKVFAVHAYTGAEADLPAFSYGGESSADVIAMLAGDGWERVAACDFGAYGTWFDGKVDVETRYLVVGFEDGPNTLPPDQWETEWIAVPEMMLWGYLAKGETAPPPFVRTFEPKPDYGAHEYLFDNDFDGASGGGSGGESGNEPGGAYSAYSTYGAAVSEVAGTNADGTEGKILKFQATTASPEFTIPAEALASMRAGTWYFIDFKIRAEDGYSAPKLTLLDSWSPIYSNSGGGNLFKPQWSGDSGRRALAPDEWHQLKARVMLGGGGVISYEVFYDGVSIGAATTTMTQALPLAGIRFQMVADPNTNRSVYYLDDFWVYAKKALPKIDASGFAFKPIQSTNAGWMGPVERAFNEQLEPDGAAVATAGTPQGADPGNDNPVPGPLAVSAYDYWGLGVDRFYLVDMGAEYEITDLYIMTKNNMQTDVPFYVWHGPGGSLPWSASDTIGDAAIRAELDASWTVDYAVVPSVANGFPNNGWGPAVHLGQPAVARYLILGCTNYIEGGTGTTTFGLQELVLYGTPTGE